MIDTSFLLSIGCNFSILATTLNILSRFFQRSSIHPLDLHWRTSSLIRHLSKFNDITFFYHLINFRKFVDFNVFMLKEFILALLPIHYTTSNICNSSYQPTCLYSLLHIPQCCWSLLCSQYRKYFFN